METLSLEEAVRDLCKVSVTGGVSKDQAREILKQYARGVVPVEAKTLEYDSEIPVSKLDEAQTAAKYYKQGFNDCRQAALANIEAEEKA